MVLVKHTFLLKPPSFRDHISMRAANPLPAPPPPSPLPYCQHNHHLHPIANTIIIPPYYHHHHHLHPIATTTITPTLLPPPDHTTPHQCQHCYLSPHHHKHQHATAASFYLLQDAGKNVINLFKHIMNFCLGLASQEMINFSFNKTPAVITESRT